MNATSKCSQSVIDTGIPSPAMDSVSVIDGQHQIITVHWAAGKRLGRFDRVDLSPLIGTHRFYAPLRKNRALFETAHLVDDGYAVAWGDGCIDMSAASVERLAEEAMTGDDFCAFLDKHSLTHQAAAAVLGRSKRQIEHYLRYEQIPRMVVLACFGYEARSGSAMNTTSDSHAAGRPVAFPDVQLSTLHNVVSYGCIVPSGTGWYGILTLPHHGKAQYIGHTKRSDMNLLNAKFERVSVCSTCVTGFDGPT